MTCAWLGSLRSTGVVSTDWMCLAHFLPPFTSGRRAVTRKWVEAAPLDAAAGVPVSLVPSSHPSVVPPLLTVFFP